MPNTAAASSHRDIVRRLAYWLVIGWWASWLWLLLAWLFNLLILTRPWAQWMVNHLPYLLLGRSVQTREPWVKWRPAAERPYPPLTRVVYWLLCGWWLSLLWTNVAALACASILGIPVGLLMLSYLPTVSDLSRLE